MKKILSMMMVVLVPLWVVSGCGYGGGGGGDGGNQDGNGNDGNGGDNNCTPHDSTACAEGVTYWVDSCGAYEEVKEMCGCGCNAGGTDCEDCTDLPCQSNSDCPTGWTCNLGTNKCEQQGCSSDLDCPSGFFCNAANVCERETCVPNCTGKCCGSDGCGSTCPNTCVPGEICDLGTCQCKPDVQCTSNEDCPQGYYCDLELHECIEETCNPQCEGKCCGSDGCGSTCPNSCAGGMTCNLSTCACESVCTSNSDCPTMYCCMDGTCYAAACGNMQCGYDPVCEFSCGTCPAGSTCNYTSGQCIPDNPGDQCPAGQECLQIGGNGVLGCLIPPSTIPDNPACSPDAPCNGNFSCYCLDEQCAEAMCVENCGTCPAGTECCELWTGGMWGCLTTGCAAVPAGPSCDANTPCQGNAGCFTDGTNNFCIDFCSSGAP